MKPHLDQTKYWDRVAELKTFNHQVNWNFLENYSSPDIHILDFGCGYGRLTHEFNEKGFHNIIGVDSSVKMIGKANRLYPQLNFKHLLAGSIPFSSNSFDLIILFAVLTCIPTQKDQFLLINELKRVLKPGGLLYLSDLLLNDDERNLKRYKALTDQPYGVFELSEGVILRHHSKEYLENELMSDFKIKFRKSFNVSTMNGNRSKAFQIIGQKKN